MGSKAPWVAHRTMSHPLKEEKQMNRQLGVCNLSSVCNVTKQAIKLQNFSKNSIQPGIFRSPKMDLTTDRHTALLPIDDDAARCS